MQEEVENRTVNLAISTTKLTFRTIVNGYNAWKRHHQANKLLLTKLPDKDSILVGWYLSWDGKHPPPCKLGVPLFLHRFGGVP